jgi:hypothetical protein
LRSFLVCWPRRLPPKWIVRRNGAAAQADRNSVAPQEQSSAVLNPHQGFEQGVEGHRGPAEGVNANDTANIPASSPLPSCRAGEDHYVIQ